MNTQDIKCYTDDQEVDCSTWISSDESNLRWEDSTYSCTPFQEQLEIHKWLRNNP